jgi:hypothetical protein
MTIETSDNIDINNAIVAFDMPQYDDSFFEKVYYDEKEYQEWNDKETARYCY